MAAEYEYAVEMKGIYKSFEGVHALQDVSLAVKPGEIHALVGENGAGKSTLIKVLSGAHGADLGEVFVKGVKADINNTKAANDLGVSVIYQEFALVPHLSVAENIFIDEFGSEYVRIDWKKLRTRAKTALESIGFGDIDPRTLVRELSVAYQQVVEICKALTRNAEILVLDEPTAVLTTKEVDKLFRLIQNLKDQGAAIIYVSHRLEEIFRITDRITVLKDGRYVDTVNTSDMEPRSLVNMMIGRDLSSFFPTRDSSMQKIGDVVLKVENISAGKAVKDVSFELREGEMLGLSGLVGAGRTEAMRAILGIDKPDGGKVWLRGKEIRLKSAKDAFDRGIGFLPEDRKNQGVLLNMPIKYNITFSCIKKFIAFLGWLLRKAEDSFTADMREKVGIKTNNLKNNVSSLSGGNQQKVAISRLLASDSKILILDEPTRGVDVGAKMEIFKLVNELLYQNFAVLMISSEMVEIIGMCDRAVVFKDGKSVGEVGKFDLTEENLIRYAMGV
ncbi:MAG: sugar ABC transporter ATP-binding protein [Clostridiales Family XIII bacterium]|jgi:ribose transport system ATP-binding protein|nr:sugar ABC transporter ATP-binding protein [Clostridiales Family XIII bacterium]